MRVLVDSAALSARAPHVDVELLVRYLATYRAVCNADDAGGILSFGSPSERFHWLTAPRSDVIQSGPVHEGVCSDVNAELDSLFIELMA
jgi:DNA polymerase sigma